MKFIILWKKLINSFFCNVLIFRSSRWQIFFKIDDLKYFSSFKGKHLCWSVFLIKLQALRPSVFINSFFYRTTPVAAFVVFAGNNVIFSFISITLGYNYYHFFLYKNIHPLSKARSSNSFRVVHSRSFRVIPAKVQTSWPCQAFIISIFQYF